MSARIRTNASGNRITRMQPAAVRSLLACAVLTLVPFVSAQTAPAPVVSTNASLPPKLTGIAHVAIRVADVAASRAFYEELGYAQPFVLTGKNGEVTESFIKINDHQYIELYPSDAAHPAAFLHVCFEAQNLPGLYPTYTGKGIVAPPVKKAGAGNLLMAWKGPEDQTEEITEYQPGSRHSNDFGQHLGGDRISTHLLGAVVPMQDPKATAQFFTSRMNFTNRGTREGANITTPPGIKDAFFAFRPGDAPEKLALVFQADPAKALTQLKSLGLSATSDHGRTLVSDPDGNLLVFTGSGL